MKRSLAMTVAAAAMLLAVSMAIAANLSFDAVVDNLNMNKNTKLHAREYWRSIEDQQVSWAGDVYDVHGGAKSHVKIYIANKSRPLYKGYNIVVSTRDVEKAAEVKKGQRIKFTGNLHDYTARYAGAVIEISEAELE